MLKTPPSPASAINPAAANRSKNWGLCSSLSSTLGDKLNRYGAPGCNASQYEGSSLTSLSVLSESSTTTGTCNSSTSSMVRHCNLCSTSSTTSKSGLATSSSSPTSNPIASNAPMSTSRASPEKAPVATRSLHRCNMSWRASLSAS